MTATPAIPPTDTPDPVRPGKRPLRYRGRRLDGPIQQFHAAIDTLDHDTVPYTYYAKVLAGRDEQPSNDRADTASMARAGG